MLIICNFYVTLVFIYMFFLWAHSGLNNIGNKSEQVILLDFDYFLPFY